VTARRARPGHTFEDVVRARTEGDFVERAWLYDEIERALESDRGQYVLVTGEPGAGKTSLLAGMARARPDRLRYFFRRDSRTALLATIR
jgi:ABC-type lipoprotein export system ATPase subunit